MATRKPPALTPEEAAYAIDWLVHEGHLYEKCECGCEKQFHTDQRCNMCGAYCIYRPVYWPTYKRVTE